MCCGQSSQSKQYVAQKVAAQPAKPAVVIPFNNGNKSFQSDPFITSLKVKQALIMQQQVARIPKKGGTGG